MGVVIACRITVALSEELAPPSQSPRRTSRAKEQQGAEGKLTDEKAELDQQARQGRSLQMHERAG